MNKMKDFYHYDSGMWTYAMEVFSKDFEFEQVEWEKRSGESLTKIPKWLLYKKSELDERQEFWVTVSCDFHKLIPDWEQMDKNVKGHIKIAYVPGETWHFLCL